MQLCSLFLYLEKLAVIFSLSEHNLRTLRICWSCDVAIVMWCVCVPMNTALTPNWILSVGLKNSLVTDAAVEAAEYQTDSCWLREMWYSDRGDATASLAARQMICDCPIFMSTFVKADLTFLFSWLPHCRGGRNRRTCKLWLPLCDTRPS